LGALSCDRDTQSKAKAEDKASGDGWVEKGRWASLVWKEREGWKGKFFAPGKAQRWWQGP